MARLFDEDINSDGFALKDTVFCQIVPGVYTPVLAKRSQNFRLADGLAAGYSPQFGQHPVTARHPNWTRNAQPVLLKNSTKSRPQRRNGDYTSK